MRDGSRILAMLRDEFRRWEDLLVGLSEEQITAPHPPSGRSVKDVVAHLRAWQQVSIARLEAARLDAEPVLPGWLEGLDPESEEALERFNARIYAASQDRSWPLVHQEWREGFLRFLGLGEGIPESDLMDAGKYPWLKGYALLDVLQGSYDHHHHDHLQPLLARLGRRGDSRSGGSSATTFSTPSAQEIVMTTVVEAPRRLAFEAWTDRRHVQHWMLGPEGWTMPVCEIDLRPGGAWQFVWRRGDGTEMGMRGTYQEIVPPERIVGTESWGGDWPETLNTVLFTDADGKTTITMRIRYPSEGARDAALDTGMKDGVAQSFERLGEYLPTMTQDAC